MTDLKQKAEEFADAIANEVEHTVDIKADFIESRLLKFRDEVVVETRDRICGLLNSASIIRQARGTLSDNKTEREMAEIYKGLSEIISELQP